MRARTRVAGWKEKGLEESEGHIFLYNREGREKVDK